MNIILTGLTSKIGTNIKPILENFGYNVTLVTVKDESYKIKINNKTDVVIHLAGIVHKKKVSDEDYTKYNVELTKQIYNHCEKVNIKHFIFMSSISIFGLNGSLKSVEFIDENTSTNPLNGYGKSKLLAEKFLQKQNKIKTTICRIPMVIGTGNYNILVKFANIFRVMPNVQNKRSVIDYETLAEELNKIILDDQNKKIFFLQNKKLLSTKELIEIQIDKKIFYSKTLGIIVKNINIKIFKSCFGSLVIKIKS